MFGKLVGLALLVGITGCAAPIKSIYVDGSQKIEGIQYRLTKTNVAVTYSVRLESCGDSPQIALLPPKITTSEGPDDNATFVVNPRDAWNLFRSIDVKEFKLSADGRLAAVSSSVTDNTIANLVEIAKSAAKLRNTTQYFSAEGTTFSKVGKGGWVCVGSEADASSVSGRVKLRSDARARLSEATRHRDELVKSGRFTQHTQEVLKAFDVAIDETKKQINDLDASLTKRVSLTPDGDKVAYAMLDLAYAWFNEKVSDPSCKLPLRDTNNMQLTSDQITEREGKITAALETSDVKQVLQNFGTKGDCIYMKARLGEPGRLLPSSEAALKSASGYGGVLYRLPGNVKVSTDAAADTGSIPTNVSVVAFAESAGNTLAVAPKSIWKLAGDGKSFAFALAQSTPMMQYGELAQMPSDIGLLTTNAVTTSFDASGTPTGATWKADPIQLPALLGLPTQVVSAFARPGINQTAVLQGNARQLMLQICIDALTSGTPVPAYCVAILN